VRVLPDAERNLDINERIKRAVTIIGGDWNMLLGTPVTGNVPLIRAGYLLVDPTSTVTTQAHGGRLDGWHADKPNPQSGCDADAPEGSKEIGENGEDK